MADDLSLLFRLRADNTQAKAVVADTRAVVNQLRQSFGPQLTQTLTVANKSFSDIDGTLTNFVAQRVPLVGSAVARVTEGIKGLGGESGKTDKAVRSVADSIQSIATQSGKSNPQIASFLAKYVQLETQSKRNDAAFKFFGGSVDLVGNKTARFTPELESARSAMAAVAAESATAAGAIATLAGPIGLVVLAFAAMAVGAAAAAREIFDLTKRTAEFQGKMFDLSQQTGLNVKTLSAFEVLTATTGGRLETITQAVVQFQRKLDEAQNPLSKTAELFRKFNIDTSDTETALRSTFNTLARMPEGFAQTNAAAELFGARGGKQVLAILKETNGDLDGAIKRFRELGILISEEDARAADKLNDELAILDFQLRAASAALVRELIPSLTEIVRSFGDVVRAARPFIDIAARIAGVTGRALESTFLGLSTVVQALTGDIEGLNRTLKELEERRNIPALNVPDLRVPLPKPASPLQSASEAVVQADALIAIVKRSVAEQNQALSVLFQQGRRNREQQAEETIASNKRVLEAERQSIDARLTLKEQEIKALDEAQVKRGEIVRRDTEDYRAITAEISKLQQERLDKESLFEVTSREIRAKAAKERADSRRNEIQNETDLLVGELERQARDIEAQIQRGATAEETGLTIIEQLERAKIDARIESRERQRDVGFLTVQDQTDINAELQKLNQERDRLADEQRNRRLERDRAAAERTREILISNLDTLIQLEQIAGERRIATIVALAQRRVITEEDAARQILQIRLGLIDDEIEATKAKLDAAKSITDKDERIRTQAELNNQIRILTEQRKGIQDEGNREIEEGGQRDLQNEREYADELEDIKQRVRDIERDAAEEVIRLMIASFARRKDIIRAQRDLDLAEEDDRHQRVTDSLNRQKRETDEQIRVLEQHLKDLTIGTTEEIEQHERLIESLEKLRLKRLELDAAQKAEDERSKTRKRRVTTESEQDEEEADPFGRLKLDTEDLKEFASVLEESIVPLGEVLAGTFRQVSDAIGQTVANWVLLGETGPAVMRKILAQALASIAAEAAVNAIKELALGFATLFFNPAESAAHFKAAALWGAIGGVAAVAGRGVAGDLFKTRTESGAGASGGRGGTGELNPLNLARNAGTGGQPQIAPQIQPLSGALRVEINDSKFADAIKFTIVDDINNAGPIREVIGRDGNLNRG